MATVQTFGRSITDFLFNTGFVRCDNCEQQTFRLSGQDDSNALSDCPTLTGDIIIAATAEGAIDLDGVEKLNGNLYNEECFDGAHDKDSTQSLVDGDTEPWKECRGLKSLYSNTLSHITGDITLSALVNIDTIDLKRLETVDGTITMEFLPHIERMNLSSLETAESLLIRHNRELVNLTMSELNNITAKESTVELVNLGIYEWPRIKVRIHYRNEKPRRLERLLAKDLPNISIFEFNNADEIGLLEVHGFENQTAMLTTDFQPTGPTPLDPFTDPIASIDNFTMVGFGGNFSISDEGTNLISDDPIVDIKHLHFVNNTMNKILMYYTVGSTRSIFVANNPELVLFEMPKGMENWQWDHIEFKDNPRLRFGLRDEEDLPGEPRVGAWEWGFNTSVLTVQNSPIAPDWMDSM